MAAKSATCKLIISLEFSVLLFHFFLFFFLFCFLSFFLFEIFVSARICLVSDEMIDCVNQIATDWSEKYERISKEEP